MRETMVNVLGLVTKATLLQKWLLISKKQVAINDSRFYNLSTTLISCYVHSIVLLILHPAAVRHDPAMIKKFLSHNLSVHYLYGNLYFRFAFGIHAFASSFVANSLCSFSLIPPPLSLNLIRYIPPVQDLTSASRIKRLDSTMNTVYWICII